MGELRIMLLGRAEDVREGDWWRPDTVHRNGQPWAWRRTTEVTRDLLYWDLAPSMLVVIARPVSDVVTDGLL